MEVKYTNHQRLFFLQTLVAWVDVSSGRLAVAGTVMKWRLAAYPFCRVAMPSHACLDPTWPFPCTFRSPSLEKGSQFTGKRIMAADIPLSEELKAFASTTRRRSSVLQVLLDDTIDLMDDETKVTPTSTASADKIDRAYDKTTQKGQENGLFRSCMDKIRAAHHEAREIRTALILLGLFTDKILYRDWISVFYAVNRELEIKLRGKVVTEDPKEQEILARLRQLGEKYYFTELYEKDLAVLYTPTTWKQGVADTIATKPHAIELIDYIRGMNAPSEFSGVLFVLWGVFIVGGGAMARQRAKAMCGEAALNVYQNVCGPGREARKSHFIAVWDDLAPQGSVQFEKITEATDMSMMLTNAMLRDFSARPWWLKWVALGSCAFVGAAVALSCSAFRSKTVSA